MKKSKEQLEMKEVVVRNPNTIIDITSNPKGGNNGGSDNKGSPTGSSSNIPQPAFVESPEKKLTLFAVRLAIIEKTAYGLGKLAFLWASVVLLGGFASALKPKDFWFVTAILIVEGTRIFSRSLELEWQNQSTRTLPAAPSRRLPYYMLQLDEQAPLSQTQRTWLPADVPLLPYMDRVFVAKNISYLLHWLEILDAAACVALSLMRLGQQDFGEEALNNQKSVLNVFYSLALAEALMFVLGKGYWTWRIEHGELFLRIIEDCELGHIGMVSLQLFFCDAHSKCIRGSIFDGLKMDLISFAEKLLDANSLDDQIIGTNILQQFLKNKRVSADTLRKIERSTPVIKRLIEMLKWKDPAEENIRSSASKIISKLASQHPKLVAAIPGAMESIVSLLHTGEGTMNGRPHEALSRDNEFSFNLLGLSILKHLTRNHDSCRLIQNEDGLLARIIDLTSSDEALLSNKHPPESRIKAVRRALKVVKNLVSAAGETGRALRRDVSDNKHLMSNIEKLLEHGGSHPELQMLGLGILTRLGMNETIKKKLGKRYRMLWLIFEVFFRPIVTEEVGAACIEAGEALAVLVLHPSNYFSMLYATEDVLTKLITALNNPVLRVNAARILRGLVAYSAAGPLDEPRLPALRTSEPSKLQIVAEAMPMVLKTIIEEENEKLLEASIGLALQILKSKKLKINENEIERAGIKDEDFVRKLVEALRRCKHPESKVPEMRMFVIGLSISLMKYDQKYVNLFRDLGMDQVLIQIAKISELEDFNVFSSTVPDVSLEEEKVAKRLWMETRELIKEAEQVGWINLGSQLN